MMRSLFAGVSGLKNHQVKMDVIGNNIANINTVGFKSGRVTFEESLTQLLKDASRAYGQIGGINPQQVGLGSAIGSISTNFAQGNLESTGNTTDLAIQGDAFFVLSDGFSEFYTRAGNFSIDGSGKLVHPVNGYVVQGKMADSLGNIASGTQTANIVLPFGQKAPAQATTQIDYSCNLNSDTEAMAQIWDCDLANYAMITATGAPGSLTIGAANDTLTIEIDDDMGSTVSRTITLTQQTYASVSNLVAEINAKIAADTGLVGEVVAETYDLSGTDVIRMRTADRGGSSTEITLSGNACANLNLSSATKVTGTDATTLLNDLAIVGESLTDGDIIRISGSNPDATVVSSDYVFTTGDDVQDLIDSINNAFSGATATISADGHLLLTDSITGETQTTVTLTFFDDDGSGSVANIPSFYSQQTGRDAGTHTASITVYDSMGATHTIALTFTNISADASPNIWSWEATVNDGDIIPTAGNKGTVRFNSDGSLAIFSANDGQDLTFVPGSGADIMNVTLNAGTTGTFTGITQLESPTTTVAKHQDGYGMGNLQTISVDDSGEITGQFSNGISQTLAQIVLATFNNPGGLMRAGNNLYSASSNSGTPVKGTVGGGIQSTISAGALEMSNVDLAQEFTDMIVAQRGFQANARVITTADTLLDEIVRLKR